MRLLIHPLPPKFGGTGTRSEVAGESAAARVRFVDPGPSDLYGNITPFGESGLLEARSEWAFVLRDHLQFLGIISNYKRRLKGRG